MSVPARLGWIILAVLCAGAFAVVTGAFNPGEKVNGLWLVVASVCFYVLAYRFYGRFLARRVLELNDARLTPRIVFRTVPTLSRRTVGYSSGTILRPSRGRGRCLGRCSPRSSVFFP